MTNVLRVNLISYPFDENGHLCASTEQKKVCTYGETIKK